MTVRPTHWYTCRTCGGPAYRRVNVALRGGQEDTDQPLLHMDEDDWVDNLHDVDGIDHGERTERARRYQTHHE